MERSGGKEQQVNWQTSKAAGHLSEGGRKQKRLVRAGLAVYEKNKNKKKSRSQVGVHQSQMRIIR